jgi:thiamine kinase-like enzyme
MDKNDDHHLLRLKDTFIHRQHLCLVFELLSVNLYELIKQNQFRGLSTTLVRVFAQQLLTGLALLSKAKLIHCDLKPENILLKKYVVYNCLSLVLIAQPREPDHQDHRLWVGLRREADGVHLYPVTLLPLPRGLARLAVSKPFVYHVD